MMSSTKNAKAKFAYGASHINPLAALSHGLIYDIQEIDYIKMLCGEGNNTKNLILATGDHSRCTSINNGTVYDLNYPTFALQAQQGTSFSTSFQRTIVNVGVSNSTYKAIVTALSLKINVEPNFLSFEDLLEKKSLSVKIEVDAPKTTISAVLIWSDESGAAWCSQVNGENEILGECYGKALRSHAETTELNQRPYIVYMGEKPSELVGLPPLAHSELLQKATGLSNEEATKRLIYSYTKSFNGFAAMLSDEEARKLSGVAAYVKSFNPTWSSAAIKSALITTVYVMSSTKNAEAEFAYGAGHINPLGALRPGLIYDAQEVDYIKMLCGEGYSTKNLRLVTGDQNSCTSTNNGTVFDLNYPTFALQAQHGNTFSTSFQRTVTNVGLSNSTYKAIVNAPSSLKINVEPNVLSFEALLEKKSFSVKIEGDAPTTTISAVLIWSDGRQRRRWAAIEQSSIWGLGWVPIGYPRFSQTGFAHSRPSMVTFGMPYPPIPYHFPCFVECSLPRTDCLEACCPLL
ncbi:Cucumisin [Dendrobium catenatum]|uniref:Cucumisin n=1 Tax=Dendrobium catenatum TaxID=906689 RepID=A0A2I0WPW1_9ASPA|nr:Cucumisin [Dendrobium catenatum]